MRWSGPELAELGADATLSAETAQIIPLPVFDARKEADRGGCEHVCPG